MASFDLANKNLKISDLVCLRNNEVDIVELSAIAGGKNTDYCIILKKDIGQEMKSIKDQHEREMKSIKDQHENIVSEIYREMESIKDQHENIVSEMRPRNVIKSGEKVSGMDYEELLQYNKTLNTELKDMQKQHFNVTKEITKVTNKLSLRSSSYRFSGKTKKQKRILKKRKLKKQKSKKEKKILNKR